MTHIHKIINNNQQKYCVIPKAIADSLRIEFGDYVKLTVQNRSIIITKITPPSESELSHNRKLEANIDFQFETPKNQNRNQNRSNNRSKSNSIPSKPNNINSIPISEEDIKNKVISILEQSQVISLSELIQKINVEDKELLVRVIRDMIENNEIIGSEQDDDLYFSLKIK